MIGPNNGAVLNVMSFIPAQYWDGIRNNTNTTPLTTYIQNALDSVDTSTQWPLTLYFPRGYYLTSNLIIQPQTTLIGDNYDGTILYCASGTTGYWITDNGSAVKISIIGMAFYGNSETGPTAGIRLGHGTDAWGGGNAHMRDVWVRDLPNAIGYDLYNNIVWSDNLIVYNCLSGIVNGGVGHLMHGIYPYGCGGSGATGYSIYLSTGDKVIQGEIEAPISGSHLIRLSRSATVRDMIFSLATGTSFTSIYEIDLAGQSSDNYTIDGHNIILNGTATFTYLIADTSGNEIITGRDSSHNGMDIISGRFYLQQNQLQAFRMRIYNNAGTLQHRIAGQASGTLPAGYANKINAASNTLQNTPTGADASTAMAYGGKISSVSTNTFIFDTAGQTDTLEFIGMATITYNNTTVDLTAVLSTSSRDVNGTTLRRMELGIINATTGANYNLTALAAGAIIDIDLLVFIL